jgi:integrase
MAKRANGEGSISKRLDGRWMARLTLEDGRRVSFYGATRGEVRDKLTEALDKRRQGVLVVGDGRQTVEQYFCRWLEDSVRTSVRPQSCALYERTARRHILPQLGKLRMTQVSAQHVQALYADRLAAGLSPKTVNLIRSVLHRAFTQATRWNLIPRNVVELADAPRVERREPSALTQEQLYTFLDAIQGHPREPLWTVMLFSGLRFGEVAALRWSDVDLPAGVLAVRHTLTRSPGGAWQLTPPKTKASRRILPLPEQAVDALRRQRVRQAQERLAAGPEWRDHDLAFTSGAGTPLWETHVLSDLHAALKAAGLPRRRLHDLRHTYATTLFALGKHPRAVQDLLGHSQVSVTLGTYTASVPTVLREAVDSLSEALRPRSAAVANG